MKPCGHLPRPPAGWLAAPAARLPRPQEARCWVTVPLLVSSDLRVTEIRGSPSGSEPLARRGSQTICRDGPTTPMRSAREIVIRPRGPPSSIRHDTFAICGQDCAHHPSTGQLSTLGAVFGALPGAPGGLMRKVAARQDRVAGTLQTCA